MAGGAQDARGCGASEAHIAPRLAGDDAAAEEEAAHAAHSEKAAVAFGAALEDDDAHDQVLLAQAEAVDHVHHQLLHRVEGRDAQVGHERMAAAPLNRAQLRHLLHLTERAPGEA